MIKLEESRTVVDAGMGYGPWVQSNQVANIHALQSISSVSGKEMGRLDLTRYVTGPRFSRSRESITYGVD